MFNRLVKITLMLMLLISFSTAFLMAGAKPAEKQKITFWSMVQAAIDLKTAQEAAIKDFEEQNNAVVELTVFPYVELQDKLLTAVAAGKGPDILLLDQIWVAQYASAGFIEPLDDRIAKSSLKADDFFPGAWGAAKYQGKQYAVPFDVGVWALLYYNKDMFRGAGLDPEKPPITWDDFYNYGKKLTDLKQNKYGTAIWVGTGDAVQCVVDAFIFSNGGKVVDDAGKKSLLNTPEAIEAFEFYKKLQEISPPGTVGRSEEDSFKLFTAGQVAMFLYGEWGQDTIAARAPAMDYGIGMLPRPADGKSIGTFGGWEMAINKKSKNKDLAFKFLEYAAQASVNKKIASLTPANKEAALAFLREKRRFPDVIYEQLTGSLYRPLVPNYPEIAEVQRAATQAILLGQGNTKDILDNAVAKINALLK
jgi:ABC-type glycerol-3-phosphate transport system substrate-binding protein